MNRNLDSSLLTVDQLLQIAIDGDVNIEQLRGKIAGCSENMALSYLREATRDIRYEMFWRGELLLDSRTERNSCFE